MSSLSSKNQEDLYDLIRTEFHNLTLRELLQKTPKVLLGVDDKAEKALNDLDIRNVFDLATSVVFGDASAIVEAGTNFQSLFFKHGAATSDIVRESEIAGKQITELQYLHISVLQHLPLDTIDKVIDALNVELIRDLALFPPYKAATRIINSVYFPENVPEYDPELPADLLPKSGEYPTEKVQYSTLLLEAIPLEEGVQIVDVGSKAFKPIDLSILAKNDTGFKKTAFGALLTFNQAWYAQGVTLGQLLHSTSLAPGESTRIAVIDWSRKSVAGETEIIQETDDLTNDQSQNRSITEVTKAVAEEAQGGFSSTNTNSTSTQNAVSAAGEMSAPLGGLLGGASGSYGETESTATSRSHADSFSSSWGKRNLSSSMAQNINERTHQHAHSNRSRRASVVKEVSQSEHEGVSTRIIANYNHMHALTIQYYEVVQIYRVEVSVAKADKVVFIPFQLIDFNNDQLIRRFQNVLARAGLTYEIRQALLNLDTIEIIPDKNNHYFNLGDTLGRYEKVAMQRSKVMTPVSMAAAPPPTAATTSIAPETQTTEQQKTLPAFAALMAVQKTNDLLWAGEQTSKLAGLLNMTVLHAKSTSLFLPNDVNVEEAEVDAEGINVKAVFRDAGNKVLNISGTVPTGLKSVASIGLSGSSPDRDIVADVVLTLNRNGVRFPVRLPSVRIPAGTKAETKLVLVKLRGADVNLRNHLMNHRMYYSQAVFRSLDVSQLAMILSGYGVQVMSGTTKQMVPVSQVVEPLPIRIIGNYLAFKMNTDEAGDVEWAEWLKLRGIIVGEPSVDIVPLATGGTFAEAILGRSNCAEKLDITRFWNWQDSPAPLQPSDIAAIQTGSRATAEDVKPGQLSSPIINIMNPAALPDPTGTAAVLSAIQNGNMFRDMSGLEATIGLASAALQATAAGATAAGTQAGTNMNNLLKANTDRQRIAAEMITSLAKTAASMYTGGAVGAGGGISGGSSGSANSSHSQDGAKINYFDKTRTPSGTSPSSSGSAGAAATTGSSSPGSTSSGGNSTVEGGYSQNPAALASTWGDSKPRSEAMSGLIDQVSRSMDMTGESSASHPWLFDSIWKKDIFLINQTTDKNCWAAAASMVSSWDKQASVPIMDTPDPAKLEDVASRYGLVLEPAASISVQSFMELLYNSGPQWICGDQPFGDGTGFHAVVVTGMYSNGDPDGSDTYLYVLDPWDRAHGTAGHPGTHLGTHKTGSRYSISWKEFVTENETAVRSEAGWMWVRFMHTADIKGRKPEEGASASPLT